MVVEQLLRLHDVHCNKASSTVQFIRQIKWRHFGNGTQAQRNQPVFSFSLSSLSSLLHCTMSHTDVKAALAAGIAQVNAWAGGEQAKIAGLKSADPSVSALTAELAGLHIDEKVPGKFLGQPLHIRDHHKQHMQTSGPALGHSPNKLAWETWVLEDAGAGQFYLSCPAHDMRICASDDKKTLNTTKNRAGWEKFTMREAGGKVIFGTAHGTFLSISDGGSVYQSPNQSAWEQFELEIVGGGKAAKKAEVEHKLNDARARVNAAAADSEGKLHAEVQRRIAAKNEAARRIEGELAALAHL